MFKIGELINYSTHGICKIDDITEKTIAGKTRTYYILQPVYGEDELRISAPVDNKSIVISEIISKDEAMEILDSFEGEGIEWYDTPNRRLQKYNKLIRSSDRKTIAKIVNTLIRERVLAEQEDRTFYAQDRKLLEEIKEPLIQELAISLDRNFEQLKEEIVQIVEEDELKQFAN